MATGRGPSSSRSQQLRPRLVDLQEFDEDEQGGFVNWPPAAQVSQGGPPIVKRASEADNRSSCSPRSSASRQPPEQAPSTRPKSRFAQQRQEQRQAAGVAPRTERLGSFLTSEGDGQGGHRFQLDLGGDELSDDGAHEQGDSSGRSVALDAQLRKAGTPSFVGSVVERRTSHPAAQIDPDAVLMREPARPDPSTLVPLGRVAPVSGFPAVTRRQSDQGSAAAPGSQAAMSAFKRSRLTASGGSTSSTVSQAPSASTPPLATPIPSVAPPQIPQVEPDSRSLISQISTENDARVAAMSQAEIEAEQRDIESMFSPDIVEMLRQRAARKSSALVDQPPLTEESSTQQTGTGQAGASPMKEKVEHGGASSALSSGVGPQARRARFADDVEVIPPSSEEAQPTSALESAPLTSDALRPYEEGTPEDIRQRFFPSATYDPAQMEWMTSAAPSSDQSAASAVRFDFSGTALSSAESASIPVHRGLHHHGERPDEAGYTVDELLHLSRSTVPSQRALALGILARVLDKYGRFEASGVPRDADVLAGLAEDDARRVAVRKEVEDKEVRLNVALIARWNLEDRNETVAAQAIDTLYVSLVRYDEEVVVEGAELLSSPPAFKEDDSHLVACRKDLVHGLLRTDLIHAFGKRFAVFAALNDVTAAQAVAILCRIAMHSRDAARQVFEAQDVLDAVHTAFLARPWPPSPEAPSALGSRTGLSPAAAAAARTSALRLLRLLADSSRDIAAKLVASGMVDTLLRFVVVPPWSAGTDVELRRLGTELLEETLRMYDALARYGMYASVVGRAWTCWEAIGRRVVETTSRFASEPKTESTAEAPKVSRPDLGLASAYLDLLTIWTTGALDPHMLDTDHDVVWSQLDTWSEVSHAVHAAISMSTMLSADVVSDAAASTDRSSVMLRRQLLSLQTSALTHLSVWLQGSAAKKPMAGAAQREGVLKSWNDGLSEKGLTRKAIVMACDAVTALSKQAGTSASQRLLDIVDDVQFLAACTRMASAASNVDVVSKAIAAANALLNADLWDVASAAEGRRRGLVRLLDNVSDFVSVVSMSAVRGDIAAPATIAHALRALSVLRPVDVETAKTLLERSLDAATSEAGPKVKALRPFYGYLLDADKRGLPSIKQGPLHPQPADLPVTTTLVTPTAVATKMQDKVVRQEILPLRTDWMFAPLDELLSSATSEVFQCLPDDWDWTELDVVSACLRLAILFLDILEQQGGTRLRAMPSSSRLIFDIMKVFMLEHGQQQSVSASGSSVEVFRDEDVAHSLTNLLNRLTLESPAHGLYLVSPSTAEGIPSTVEEAASADIVVPFYQFYTDFVGLYDAVSFSDPSFARLLLPPLSMSYAPDYRRLLWIDYAHLLSTIHARPEDVPLESSDGLTAFFWPVETDRALLAAYAGALAKDQVQRDRTPFLYWIAAHHLASNLWNTAADVGGEGRNTGASPDEAVKRKWADMARALFASSSIPPEVMRDLVRYRRVGERVTSLQDAVTGASKALLEDRTARLGTVLPEDTFARLRVTLGERSS